jgi:hypothetical protein
VRTPFTYHGPTFLRPDGSVGAELKNDIRSRLSNIPRMPVMDTHDMARIDFERSCTKALRAEEEEEAYLLEQEQERLQLERQEQQQMKLKNDDDNMSSGHQFEGMESGRISLGENSMVSHGGQSNNALQQQQEQQQQQQRGSFNRNSSTRRSSGTMARHGANSLKQTSGSQSEWMMQSHNNEKEEEEEHDGSSMNNNNTNAQVAMQGGKKKKTKTTKKSVITKAQAPVQATRKKKPFNSDSLFDCLLDLKFGKTDAKSINQLPSSSSFSSNYSNNCSKGVNGHNNSSSSGSQFNDQGWDITSFRDKLDVHVAMPPKK